QILYVNAKRIDLLLFLRLLNWLDKFISTFISKKLFNQVKKYKLTVISNRRTINILMKLIGLKSLKTQDNDYHCISCGNTATQGVCYEVSNKSMRIEKYCDSCLTKMFD